MNKNIILIIGTIMIIVGAILKVTHTLETSNDWIFRTGFALGLIYLLLKNRKIASSNK